jgi:hypothetical protein
MRYPVIALLSCGLAAVAYFAMAIAMVPAPIEAEYWVREMIVVKREMARAHADRRKLIVASGSATLFGVDTAQLGRELGLPVLNFGLHAAMSLERILDEAAGAAAAGDALILALEPEYYCARGPSQWQARNAIAWDREQWRAWSARERVEAVAALGSSALLKIAAARRDLAFSPELLHRRLETLDDTKVLSRAAAAPEPTRFAYSAHHLDALGNMRGTSGSNFHGTPTRLADAATAVCSNSVGLLRAFVSQTQRRGVAVRLAHAPYVANGHTPIERIRAASRTFATAVSAIAPILDSREDVLFHRALFFNTELHLNALGREIRTRRLAEAIRHDRALCIHLEIRCEDR